jgi:hypothetical protein
VENKTISQNKINGIIKKYFGKQMLLGTKLRIKEKATSKHDGAVRELNEEEDWKQHK